MAQNEPFKLILEIDGKRLTRPELISKEKHGEEPFFWYTSKYITHRGTSFYNWYPEVHQAAQKIYDQEIKKIGQNKLKLSQQGAQEIEWKHRFFREEISLNSARKLIKYVDKVLAEIYIWQVLGNYQGLKTQANLGAILSWKDGEDKIWAEVLNYSPTIRDKETTYQELIEKELVEMSSREMSKSSSSEEDSISEVSDSEEPIYLPEETEIPSTSLEREQ